MSLTLPVDAGVEWSVNKPGISTPQVLTGQSLLFTRTAGRPLIGPSDLEVPYQPGPPNRDVAQLSRHRYALIPNFLSTEKCSELLHEAESIGDMVHTSIKQCQPPPLGCLAGGTVTL